MGTEKTCPSPEAPIPCSVSSYAMDRKGRLRLHENGHGLGEAIAFDSGIWISSGEMKGMTC